MKKVFSIVRKIFDRKPTDDLNDLDVNTAVCVFFFSCLSHVKLQFILESLHGKSAIYQESIFEVCGAIVSHN